jgi:hypothetical protein
MEKSIAFFRYILSFNKAETKKAMGAWKPPMAFNFNSNDYTNAGQTSSMSSQHHQFLCVTFKIFLIWILSLKLNIF